MYACVFSPPTTVFITSEKATPLYAAHRTEEKDSGSVGMGSMGSLEPINSRTVGSGTHQFWKERTKICPLFSQNQARNEDSEYGDLD